MVRNFRGQVKISDVQEEFDNLTSHINNMIDSYNEAAGIEGSIDYTKGSSIIAPQNYTLTIGALKKILNAYNGSVLGSQVYHIDGTDTYQVTDGLYINNGKPIRLKQGLLEGSGNILYYDLTHEAYTFGDTYLTSGSGVTVVTKPFALPNMVSNNSFGSITGGINYTNAGTTNGKDRVDLYTLLNNGYLYTAFFADTKIIPEDGNIFVWTFQQPLNLTQIKFTHQLVSLCTFEVTTLDGKNVLYTHSGLSGNSDSKVAIINLDGNTAYNGFKIRFYGNPSGRIGYTAMIGGLSITANETTTVYIPAGQSQGVDKNNLITVANLNTNRISPLCNTPNFVAGDIDGFKIGSKSKNITWNNLGVDPLNNSKKGQFVGAFNEMLRDKTMEIKLFSNAVVASAGYKAKGHAEWFGPLNRLFVPKGIPNPYTTKVKQMCLDYTIERPKFNQT